MLNNLINGTTTTQEWFYADNEKLDAAINNTKIVFGENLPYTIEYVIGGRKYVFSDHFVSSTDIAFVLGCLSTMNIGEIEVFEKYLIYADGLAHRDITWGNDQLMTEYDEWLGNVRREVSNTTSAECGIISSEF